MAAMTDEQAFEMILGELLPISLQLVVLQPTSFSNFYEAAIFSHKMSVGTNIESDM